MGTEDAALKSRDGAYPEEYLYMSHSPRPIEVSQII